MKSAISLIFLLFLLTESLFASPLKNLTFEKDREYTVRLTNGDVISGYLTEFVSDAQDGDGIKLRTALGTAVIYENQIITIDFKENSYRHGHRVFLLPTAEGIKNNYFIGDFEMLFLYAGIGIGDLFSISAGRSFIPFITSSQQISAVNAKFTVVKLDFDSTNNKLLVAVGGNLGWANSPNKLEHAYAVATYKMSRTSLTANIFYKIGTDDYYDVNFYNSLYPMYYQNAAWGIGLGVDSKLPNWESLHVIGELWNNDISQPTRTGILLGVRICNTAVSADFGIAFFTQPFIVPFMSFVWTPF